MLRKTMVLLLALCMTMFVAGCGEDDSSSDSKSSDSKTEETDAGDDDPTDPGDDGSSDEPTTGDEPDGGEESGGGAEGGGEVLELSVTGNELQFDKTELEGKAGTVTLKLTNDSSIPHNIAVKDGDTELGEPGELVTGGDVSETTVELEAGKTYTFYCVPHEGAGMVGELTVA